MLMKRPSSITPEMMIARHLKSQDEKYGSGAQATFEASLAKKKAKLEKAKTMMKGSDPVANDLMGDPIIVPESHPRLQKSKSYTPQMVMERAKSLQQNKYTSKDPSLQKKLSKLVQQTQAVETIQEDDLEHFDEQVDFQHANSQPPLLKKSSSYTPEMVLARARSLQENKYTMKDPSLQKKLSKMSQK